MRNRIPTKQGFVCVGTILGAHGIKGEVKFKLALENEDIVKNYGVPVDEDGTPFSITSWRQGPKGPLVKFKNIPTREDAEEFRGTALFVPREEFPELEEDELYYSDLEGMTVLNHKGDKIGKVGSVFSNGAQDVFTVFGKGSEVLLPYTDDTIATSDLEAKTITLTEFADEFFNL